jgi:hypothetical protein
MLKSQTKKIMIFSLFFLFSLIMMAKSANAANHYVRQGASGSGADWSSALGNLPSSLNRGDVYYIAGGSYGNYNFQNAGGTGLVTVKKATVADHGTATGWSDSYASGQAIFTGWNIYISNLLIDGQTGGGPGQWESGHGIAVRNQADHLLYGGSTNVSNVTIKHVEIDGVTNAAGDRDAIYFLGGFSSFTMSYIYLHDIGCDIAQIQGSISNFVLEYSEFTRNNQTASCHGDVFEFNNGTASNWVHRYNWFKDTVGTYLWGTHENGSFNGAQIYGNIISGGYYDNGVLSTLSGGGTINNLQFYNNTFAAVGGINAGFQYLERGSNNQIYNNLVYLTGTTFYIGGTHDYNWYYGVNLSESHGQTGAGNPFVNMSGGNFNLSGGTSAGMSLGATFNMDMFGKTRGADGVWDRGAIEYGSGGSGDTTPPSAPKNVTVK